MLDDVTRLRLPGGDPGIEIAVLDFGGSGPPVLLNHANGFCAALWAPVAESLCPHFRVFAMDARGHGDSSKPAGDEAYAWAALGRDAGAVAAQLAADHGPLALGLGHSFGGTCLLLAASENPTGFGRVMLLDPPFPPAGELRAQWHGRGNPLAEGARRRRHAWSDRAAARERWAGRPLFASWSPRALDLYAAEGLTEAPDGGVTLKCRPETEATLFERAIDVDLADRPQTLSLPVRFLWARRGDFQRAHFETLAASMPNADVRDADAGHLMVMEQPELVAAEALRFSLRPEVRAATGPSRLRASPARA
ncbi:MAG: alpha/beta hydrolase [Deltaproteobacteria bacterium]|nr:alpha/beta hydrolase [Deltaproteobacteria bacterium]MBW2362345.1 alpha/beta hydrolase [Deltaproteobacteria bacterium]